MCIAVSNRRCRALAPPPTANPLTDCSTHASNTCINLKLQPAFICAQAAALAGGRYLGRGDKNAADQVPRQPCRHFYGPVAEDCTSVKLPTHVTAHTGNKTVGFCRSAGCSGPDATGAEHCRNGRRRRDWRGRERRGGLLVCNVSALASDSLAREMHCLQAKATINGPAASLLAGISLTH